MVTVLPLLSLLQSHGKLLFLFRRHCFLTCLPLRPMYMPEFIQAWKTSEIKNHIIYKYLLLFSLESTWCVLGTTCLVLYMLIILLPLLLILALFPRRPSFSFQGGEPFYFYFSQEDIFTPQRWGYTRLHQPSFWFLGQFVVVLDEQSNSLFFTSFFFLHTSSPCVCVSSQLFFPHPSPYEI